MELRPAACALALALAATGPGCGGDVTVIAPVIDGPAPGTAAAAFPDLDEIELTLARAGAATNLATATFRRGDTIELGGVPEGTDLVVHLTGRLGGSDVAYGRTCAFAVTADEPSPSPHLWFARTVTWGEVSTTLAAVRIGGDAAIYHDGSAMFLGGEDVGGAVPALERFDPVTGELTTVAYLAPRRGGAVARLGDGRLVVLGGVDDAHPMGSPRVELVELDTSPDRRVDAFDEPRLARAGVTTAELTDGRVIVFGGGPSGGAPLAAPIEIAIDGGTVAIRELRATMAMPRRGATATRLSDDLGAAVLLVGGLDAAGVPVAQAELWKPLREDFADPLIFMPLLRVPRSGHAAARMPDGSVLVLGGVDAAGLPVRELELFAVDTGFVDAGQLPPGAGLIDATVTDLPDGRLLVTGGRGEAGGEAVATSYIVDLDPLDGSVDLLATDGLSAPRAGHAAGRLCDGTIVVLGGSDRARAIERYSPPASGRR